MSIAQHEPCHPPLSQPRLLWVRPWHRRGGRSNGGGASTWTTAPDNTPPSARLVVELPESEFTYIERPWSHFVSRWAAIDQELERSFGKAPFSLVDLGSCCGFFSLQAAAGYPDSLIAGVEGSVGIGNGTSGVTGSEDQIIATKAVQTHLRWIEKLYLPNCLIAPEVWDYRRVCQLAALGRPISDVLLSLSVIHHIDSVSTQQYSAARLSHIEGTLSLMAKLLELAPRHFIELPDRPWLEHVHSAYGTAHAFLDAAAKSSTRQWSFTGPLCVSEWYGVRELWLLEDVGPDRPALPRQGLKALFPRVLGPPESAAPGPPRGAAEADALRPQLTQEQLGAALLAAPTALIASHVQLRDALASAAATLQDSRALR